MFRGKRRYRKTGAPAVKARFVQLYGKKDLHSGDILCGICLFICLIISMDGFSPSILALPVHSLEGLNGDFLLSNPAIFLYILIIFFLQLRLQFQMSLTFITASSFPLISSGTRRFGEGLTGNAGWSWISTLLKHRCSRTIIFFCLSCRSRLQNAVF